MVKLVELWKYVGRWLVLVNRGDVTDDGRCKQSKNAHKKPETPQRTWDSWHRSGTHGGAQGQERRQKERGTLESAVELWKGVGVGVGTYR